MRKALVTVVLSAVALVAGTVAATAPASADEVSTPADATTTGVACIPAGEARFTKGGWSRTTPGELSTTLKGPEGAALCDEVRLNVSWYYLAPSWNGSTVFAKAQSTPQTLGAHAEDLVFAEGTLVGATKTATVGGLPVCDPYQIDLYTGQKLDTVTQAGHGGAFLAGGIVPPRYDADDPQCQEPTPSTTTEVPTTEPTTGTSTTESTTDASTTSEPSTTSTAGTTSTGETGTTTVASTTGATSVATTVAGTTSVAPTTSEAPALAFTGAAGTGTLVGLGAALLVGGVGITLLAASRRGATHRG